MSDLGLHSPRGPHWARATRAVAILLVTGVLAAACSSSSANSDASSTYAGAPGLLVSGTSGGWSFHDGQSVSVSMGANKTFVPLSRLIIIQCADPKGTQADLPTKFANCDGNTIQGDSVIVRSDGSFSEKNFTVYKLPSATLGEQANWQPVCSATKKCVLFIGENQNDFTKPKVFSHPFVVTSGSSGSGS
jgi:hypothetical protein